MVTREVACQKGGMTVMTDQRCQADLRGRTNRTKGTKGTLLSHKKNLPFHRVGETFCMDTFSPAYDALDHQTFDQVIRQHGLKNTLLALAELMRFHSQDMDEPLLTGADREIATDAAMMIAGLAR
jgi:hypothetical protein